jgi:hypothetical protein
MHRPSHLVPLCLAAAFLAGCAGSPVISHSYVADNYAPETLNYPASRGGLYTEVVGNPFEAEKDLLDSRVTEAFETAHFGPRLDFVTEQPPGHSGYRVVVLFDPAPQANAARLCSSPERPRASRAPGEVGVMASFCLSDSRLTSAVGRIDGAKGPNDPALGRLLAQVGLALFPPAPGPRDDEPKIKIP